MFGNNKYYCINISVICYEQACFDEHKNHILQDDSRADNDLLWGFPYARFRAILHQYGINRKFAVVDIDVVCEKVEGKKSIYFHY